MGSALVHEIHAHLETLSAAGEDEAARNLRNLEHKIAEIVNDAKVMIAHSGTESQTVESVEGMTLTIKPMQS